MTKTALYRHYDAGGRLLYVGITERLGVRDRQHRSTSSWHDDVAETRTQWFDAREIAIAAERFAIRTEAPIHNKAYSAPESEHHNFACQEIADFAAEVCEFGERHGFKPSTIMQNACQNGKSWYGIVAGKDMTFGTARKVRAWMEAYDAKGAAS